MAVRVEPAVAQGLSPRVRGSPAASGGGAVSLGSIPACAGEPAVPPLA